MKPLFSLPSKVCLCVDLCVGEYEMLNFVVPVALLPGVHVDLPRAKSRGRVLLKRIEHVTGTEHVVIGRDAARNSAPIFGCLQQSFEWWIFLCLYFVA